jgi:pilus assembly protein CpaD
MSSNHLPIARLRGAQVSRLLAIAGCAAMLAGCYTDRTLTASTPIDYRQRHPIAIREGTRTVELFIGSKRDILTATQRADVLAFAQEWHREATGGILIDLPAGTSNELAAAHALPEIRSILHAAGVPPRGVGVRNYRPDRPAALATVRVSYTTMVASAGPCGFWPHDLGPTLDREYNENREYWNLGCANQRNLAAMVENPADLVQPRGEVPPYTGRRTTVLDKYHRGESTATINPSSDKAKITDIGK